MSIPCNHWKDVCEVMTKFMRDPIKILIKTELITLEGIKQFYIAVEKEEHKFETLIDLYETMSVVQCIIYVNTRRKVEWLGKQMAERDHVVSIIHGDLKPEERTIVMQEFRTGSSRVLLSSDVLARGIDVETSFSCDQLRLTTSQGELYSSCWSHGSFRAQGTAISFITEEDVRAMREIEKFYSTQISELPSDVRTL